MSNQEQKPFFSLYPNQQVKTISYAPMGDNPSTLKQTDGSIYFFDYTPSQKPKVIAGNGVKLDFSYTMHDQLETLRTTEHSTELRYDLLGEVKSQSQDEIEVAYSKDVNAHSHTVRFLESQTITTTIAHNTQAPIRLSYDLKAKTQTTTYPNGTQEHYTFNINKELTTLQTAEQNYQYQRDGIIKTIPLFRKQIEKCQMLYFAEYEKVKNKKEVDKCNEMAGVCACL